MNSTLITWLVGRLQYLSRICGFDTADSFPSGHPYARTRWNAAYFDIASDVKPEQIERRLCDAIANTPTVFAYISNPTPRMQRALFGVIEERLRRNAGAGDLVLLLINAYRSPHIMEAAPGLRTVMHNTEHEDSKVRIAVILEFLKRMQYPFDVIEMQS
ncbi:hypothetical protein [Janthinobacterium agaricidamnosum]|uniref:hypothetical protein n=1 Tax=Janthinobacterium agaricidamnosum TaxID=55508 RepID=UPI000571DF80|nr:hypothetical protein [Janthinobacterium agaricidamnosum]